MAKTGRPAGRPAKKAEKTEKIVASPKGEVMNGLVVAQSDVQQIFRVTDRVKEDEIMRYAALPGVRLEFDPVHFLELADGFVAMLEPDAQKSYWLAKAEFDSRKREADRALYETPTAVDPMAKLLDGPRGMANPITRDLAMLKALAPEYYFTTRLEGGQGDLTAALEVGFRVMRHPKDDTEERTKPPTEWSGERWKIRDGVVDPTSGDEIYNVIVYIRQRAWDDNLVAMSMVSHNKYSQNKKQFVEGVDNISRDMLSSKERIQVSDLDETHAEEHTVVKDGKRIQVNP